VHGSPVTWSSFLFFPLPALADIGFDNLTVTERSPKHLCLSHLMTGGTVPLRDTPSLCTRNRESGYLTKEGTS
jgi:hypothetical protein